MKKYLPHVLFIALVATYAWASSIKVWSSGEVLRSADLNSNFAHIHNTKVGDGVLLVNSDVSGSAAISHSKLATPLLIPKAIVYFRGAAVGNICNASPCTMGLSSGITGVTWSSTGIYVVTLAVPRTTNAVLQVSTTTIGVNALCSARMATTTTAQVACINSTTGAAIDAEVYLTIFDN